MNAEVGRVLAALALRQATRQARVEAALAASAPREAEISAWLAAVTAGRDPARPLALINGDPR